MAALILASIAALIAGGEKLHQKRKKKQALKAQDASQHGPIEEVSIIDDETANQQTDDLPAYHKETLPPYHPLDEHPASRSNKQNVGSPHS
jgi:hypothetical protein